MLPPVVKNLLILNGLFFLAKFSFGTDELGRNLLDANLGMYYLGSPHFRPWQIITHMFMHGGLGHIFTNMFGLFMFGGPIEQRWGSKRFLTYYLICGLGAAALHTGVNAFEVMQHEAAVTSYGADLSEVKDAASAMTLSEADRILNEVSLDHRVPERDLVQLYYDYQGTMIGASGAVFGILLAFGMMFPNQEILMLFFPVPIKAKYFVALYGILELVMGVRQGEGDNIAHFAHVGGMLFGFLLIRYWKRHTPFL
ncbi:MAG: rhomboid family intramembrane serine protease [Flavobacteriales bacterium]|nr:rhomboid family intramembrane serine protease [Flavobacteriales bacterium]